MAEMKLTGEEAAALDRIEAELSRPGATALAEGGVEDLCKLYKKLKGPLEILVELLKKGGGLAAKVAAALELLMKIADQVCPA